MGRSRRPYLLVLGVITSTGDRSSANGWWTQYLEFVAGRCRPNTLRAVAFDLKAFFTVISRDPVAVTAADVFEFLAHQRGDRTVVRLADGESGLSARTIAPPGSSCCQALNAAMRGPPRSLP